MRLLRLLSKPLRFRFERRIRLVCPTTEKSFTKETKDVTEPTTDQIDRDYLLSHTVYDRLKLFALIIFPAVGVFYASLAAIWGLPYATEVLSTIVAIDTFLGVIIKIGDVTYNASESKFDGRFWVDQTDRGTTVTPQFKADLPELAKQDQVTLKVQDVPKT
jgi:hypothetical protein